MLMGLDLVRTLYHVDPGADPALTAARAASVVDDFLDLHRPAPAGIERD